MAAPRLAHKYQNHFCPRVKESRDPNSPQNWGQARPWVQRGESLLRSRARATWWSSELGHLFLWSLASSSRSFLGMMCVPKDLSLKLFTN